MNSSGYAINPNISMGRLYTEQSFFNNPIEYDAYKLIHCSAFRRLEYKTQVFMNEFGDHYRTRLTHSVETAQIGKVIATALNLHSNLTEILCLIHDIGHPPFGHAGEEMLNNIMSKHKGFNHNIYGFKLITEIEERDAKFRGLNLSWEILEGFVKHNGPILGKYASAKYPLEYLIAYNQKHDLSLDKFPSLEAQIAGLSDDIAYNSHDLEDGLKSNLFSLNDLYEAEIINHLLEDVDFKSSEVDLGITTFSIMTRLIDYLIKDVLLQSKNNIEDNGIRSFTDVQKHDACLISFSKAGLDIIKGMNKFLMLHMYTNPKILNMRKVGEEAIFELYHHLLKNPEDLPGKWLAKAKDNSYGIEEVICDYIAGMTDRFAIKLHKNFCRP